MTPKRPHGPRSAVAISLVLPVLAASTEAGWAEGYQAKAAIAESLSYDSNPLLETSGAKGLYGSTTTPSLDIEGNTPNTHLSWTNSVYVNQFNLSRFSSTDFLTDLTGGMKAERFFANMDFNFDYDTTRTSEITSSGINLAGVRHRGLNIKPEIGWDVSPTGRFLLDAGYLSSRYANTAVYTNYRVETLSPSYEQDITPTDTIPLALDFTRFDALSGASTRTESVGPSIGWKHKVSHRLDFNVSGGYHWITTHTEGAPSTRRGDYFFSLAADYNLSRQDVVTLKSYRQLAPQSSSQETTQTSFGLEETHAFSERTSTDLTAQYIYDSYPITIDGVQKHYFEGAATIYYQLSDTLKLDATYRYRQQDLLGVNQSANSQAVIVDLTYTPDASLFRW